MDEQQQIIELERKVSALEERLSSSIIFDKSLIKRALGVFGYNLLAQLILFVPMMIIFMIIASMFTSLFFPGGIGQGW